MKKELLEINNKMAEMISTLLMSLENKEQRVFGLNNLSKIPNVEVLKIVNMKALENEDFETCEALKIYAESNNIKL